jgi:hypothetical protein
MWEHPDKQTTFAPDVLLRSNTTSLNRLSLEPGVLQGLKSEIAERNLVTPSRVTF